MTNEHAQSLNEISAALGYLKEAIDKARSGKFRRGAKAAYERADEAYRVIAKALR